VGVRELRHRMLEKAVAAHQDGPDENGRAMDHPVGSNAYRLKQWLRGQKVVLEANPNFREVTFPAAPPNADAATKALAATMAGKRLPQIRTIDIAIVEESQPRLLMFGRGELDILNVPRELAPRVMDAENRLLPEYARRGVQMQRAWVRQQTPRCMSFAATEVGLQVVSCPG